MPADRTQYKNEHCLPLKQGTLQTDTGEQGGLLTGHLQDRARGRQGTWQTGQHLDSTRCRLHGSSPTTISSTISVHDTNTQQKLCPTSATPSSGISLSPQQSWSHSAGGATTWHPYSLSYPACRLFCPAVLNTSTQTSGQTAPTEPISWGQVNRIIFSYLL